LEEAVAPTLVAEQLPAPDDFTRHSTSKGFLAGRFRDPANSIVERLPDGIVVVHQRPGIMHEPHWHAQVEVNFIFRGHVSYQMSDLSVDVGAGELALFWGGLPHMMSDASPDAFFMAVHLPLVHFFRLHLSPDLTQKLTQGAIVIVPDVHGNDAGNFDRWAEYFRAGDSARTGHAINELLLRIDRIQFEPFRLVEPAICATEVAEALDPRQFNLIRKICSFVTDNFREDIDMEDIAAAANLHPKSTMRLFKRSTGMTLYKYLSLLRLSYAEALLMNDNMSVIDVAMNCGFGSLGAFNSSFGKLAGKSPSQFRRDSRALPNLVGAQEQLTIAPDRRRTA
jgi:AraC-like DNA-binding protein